MRPTFQLRIRSRQADRGDLTVPCDERGHVDLNRMTSVERTAYLAARALRGRIYDWTPVVQALH